jgi:hypothetical protein
MPVPMDIGDPRPPGAPVSLAKAPAGAEDPAAVCGDDGEEIPTPGPRLREAVMYGAPYEAAELVLVTTSSLVKVNPLAAVTVSPLRRPRSRTYRTPLRDGTVGPRPRQVGQREPADQVADALIATGRPMRWGPGALARAAGAAEAVVIMVGSWYLTRSLMTEGLGWRLLPLLGFLMLTEQGAVLLNWRVTADSTGLWLTGAWKVLHVPWERVRAVRYTEEGRARIRIADGDLWQPGALGWPSMERLLRIRPAYARMPEEIAALRDHPELRPTRPSPPSDHGLPLGPVLVLLAVLAAVAAITTGP